MHGQKAHKISVMKHDQTLEDRINKNFNLSFSLHEITNFTLDVKVWHYSHLKMKKKILTWNNFSGFLESKKFLLVSWVSTVVGLSI